MHGAHRAAWLQWLMSLYAPAHGCRTLGDMQPVRLLVYALSNTLVFPLVVLQKAADADEWHVQVGRCAERT